MSALEDSSGIVTIGRPLKLSIRLTGDVQIKDAFRMSGYDPDTTPQDTNELLLASSAERAVDKCDISPALLER